MYVLSSFFLFVGSRFCQFLAQEACCVALVLLCYLLRRSYGYDVAAAASTFGAEVYDVVSAFYDLKVVFYDDEAMASFD